MPCGKILILLLWMILFIAFSLFIHIHVEGTGCSQKYNICAMSVTISTIPLELIGSVSELLKLGIMT